MPNCEYFEHCSRRGTPNGCESNKSPSFKRCRRAARKTGEKNEAKPFDEQEFYPKYQDLRESGGGNGYEGENHDREPFGPILIDVDTLLLFLLLYNWNIHQEFNAKDGSKAGLLAIGPKGEELFI